MQVMLSGVLGLSVSALLSYYCFPATRPWLGLVARFATVCAAVGLAGYALVAALAAPLLPTPYQPAALFAALRNFGDTIEAVGPTETALLLAQLGVGVTFVLVGRQNLIDRLAQLEWLERRHDAFLRRELLALAERIKANPSSPGNKMAFEKLAHEINGRRSAGLAGNLSKEAHS